MSSVAQGESCFIFGICGVLCASCLKCFSRPISICILWQLDQLLLSYGQFVRSDRGCFSTGLAHLWDKCASSSPDAVCSIWGWSSQIWQGRCHCNEGRPIYLKSISWWWSFILVLILIILNDLSFFWKSIFKACPLLLSRQETLLAVKSSSGGMSNTKKEQQRTGTKANEVSVFNKRNYRS